MYSTANTALLDGIRTIPVLVEVDFSSGLPMFDMVGSLSPEVREAKERVKTALHNCGINLPPRRITINLSPSNIRKSGSGFDLPIAVALLGAMGLVDTELSRDKIFIGELGLNGDILPVSGVLPIVSDGMKAGKKVFVVPEANRNEAKLVKGATVYSFSDLRDVIDFLSGVIFPEAEAVARFIPPKHMLDFAEVNGQTLLKRACEVAASGMHNMLMVGPPGAGKTMVSERMPSILPPLTEEEKLELSKIYSVCGLLDNSNTLVTDRPFRSPHHTITRAGLTGGGIVPKPGEISLAHHGILFLDELTEFQKNNLEIMRQPLEDHEIRLTRSNYSVSYPADFLLLAAMNPCNCGYFPNMQRCTCSPSMIERYMNQISQPLLDRIDICVEASAVSYQELTGRNVNESSEAIRQRVVACHQLQYERFKNESFSHNSQIPAARMDEFCALGEKEKHYMEAIYDRMRLTGRSYHKILRVARTIADMNEDRQISLRHLNEAVCYRSVTEKYWGGRP